MRNVEFWWWLLDFLLVVYFYSVQDWTLCWRMWNVMHMHFHCLCSLTHGRAIQLWCLLPFHSTIDVFCIFIYYNLCNLHLCRNKHGIHTHIWFDCFFGYSHDWEFAANDFLFCFQKIPWGFTVDVIAVSSFCLSGRCI